MGGGTVGTVRKSGRGWKIRTAPGRGGVQTFKSTRGAIKAITNKRGGAKPRMAKALSRLRGG